MQQLTKRESQLLIYLLEMTEPVTIKQLAEKDEQMRVKDRQIAEKDKQLDQQQQLTLQAMKDQETLQLELDQAKQEVQATKKGFFARLFGG